MTGDVWQQAISRRRLLRDAAVAGTAAALPGSAAPQARPRRRRPRRRTVAVLGGGMAGLAAAHELAERGFDVTVFERHRLGGKARSMPVPGTGVGGRRPLPGEHGFRFFPGFYHHVPDTMRRIPFPGNANGVADNFVSTPEVRLARAGAEDVFFPFEAAQLNPGPLRDPEKLVELLVGGLKLGAQVPPHEVLFFAQRLMVFFTSCDERRFGQWEHVPWIKFVKPEGKSAAYRSLMVKFATRAVVAAKEEVASTRTIGNMAEAFLMSIAGRGNDGATDRLLIAPTNEAWIGPWVSYLRDLGVDFRRGWSVRALRTRNGRVSSAHVSRNVRGRHRHYEAEADWFVCALPPERARKLWTRNVLKLDPSLERMNDLVVDWMVGLQFYLRRQITLAEGHVAYMDSPWALTSISQGHFWEHRDLARDYGDGTVRDCLSVDISDWDTPGLLFGKPAKQCTKDEVANETWAQIKAHVNDAGRTTLRDEDLHSSFLDPGIKWDQQRRRNSNATPLLVNTVGTWEKRPRAHMNIPNLFHAGDHVQTNIDLATMEGANESARAAVNALLDASGSKARPAQMYKLFRPPEYELAKQFDQERYRAGQRNLLDS